MAEFGSLPLIEQMGVTGQQVVVGQVFDGAPYGQIVAALKVIATGGAAPQVDVEIQHSMDMDQWATLVSFNLATVATYEIVSGTKFARYLRAVADTTGGSADTTATFSVLGIARAIG